MTKSYDNIQPISSRSFDNKFKNAIRDYYTYGFKGKYSASKNISDEILRQDHNRLNNILVGYMRWHNSDNRRFFYCGNSQSLKINPFQKIYSYCAYNDNDWKFFYNMIMPLALLSYTKTYLNEKTALEIMNAILSYAFAERSAFSHENVAQQICKVFLSLKRDIGLTTSQLYCLYPYNGYDILLDSSYKTLQRKISWLLALGILVFSEFDKRRYYNLSKITLRAIINEGEKINCSFLKHFERALDFYSRYYIFGTLGSYMLARLGNANKSSHFRFKHEYYMQSINEFNLIDLLIAIEKEKVCLIEYRHGVTETKKHIIAYPLEIRISSVTGREFLMYYAPLQHSYKRLRVEFIDNIKFINKNEFIDKLKLNDQNFNMELKQSRDALKHSWGVSISPVNNNASTALQLKKVSMRILYNPKNEKYILNRVKREKRIGRYKLVNEVEKSYIDFEADVLDEVELRPWIRSFYKRIICIEGMENREFSVASDVDEILGVLHNGLVLTGSKVDIADSGMTFLDLPSKLRIDDAKEHDKLFNEIFSNNFRDMSKDIIECYCKEKNINLEERKMSHYIFYRDILPLTNLEKRWLKTILEDDKISYFLNENEIVAINNVLSAEGEIRRFDTESIRYYDRYGISDFSKQNEKLLISSLLDAIDKKKFVHIKYQGLNNSSYENLYYPVIIEYSQRDNLFRGYFLAKNKEVFTLNIARIVDMYETEVSAQFSNEDVANFLKSVRKYREKKVIIEFYDVKNLPDRILTEFSPWKKEVVYDSATKLYRLTLYYDKSDKLEIVNRLMGYGKTICFANREDAIYKEIYSRIEQQQKLL